MAVTFIDTPGTIPQTETLEFTTTRPVVAVSVEYHGQRPWDVVYQDGRFSQIFQTSTFDGTTWRIRPPLGRWAYPPRLIVDEEATAAVAGWEVLYAVDLAAQATQAMVASQGYTIDGLTWYAKGDLVVSGATYTRGVTNGLGLGIRHTAGVAGTQVGTSGILNYPHFFLPLASIPGFVPDNPYLVQGRFVFDALGDPNGLLGVIDTTSDGTRLQAADRAKDRLVGPAASGGTTNSLAYKLGAGGLLTATAGHAAVANNGIVPGVFHFTSRFGGLGSQILASGLPADETSWVSVTNGLTADAGTPSNPGVAFMCNSGTGGLFGVYLQQVQILQQVASI